MEIRLEIRNSSLSLRIQFFVEQALPMNEIIRIEVWWIRYSLLETEFILLIIIIVVKTIEPRSKEFTTQWFSGRFAFDSVFLFRSRGQTNQKLDWRSDGDLYSYPVGILSHRCKITWIAWKICMLFHNLSWMMRMRN